MEIGSFLTTKALAQEDVPTLRPAEAANIDSISSLFGGVVNLLALIAGVVAFIYLVYSGILYLTAAGNPDAAKKGQQGIINAIIGIIIIVAAWAIIKAVEGTTGSTVDTPDSVTFIMSRLLS